MENREEILYKHIEWIFASDREKESFLNAMSEHSDQQNKALLEEIERLKGEKEDLKSKLLLSEQNVKLNYNMLLDADNSITAYRANIEQLQIELKAAESGNEGLSKSKLEILNEVKFSFDIHSDFSSQCNGYKSLCKQIEHLTNLTQTNKR